MGSGGGPFNAPILFWFGLDFKTQAIPMSLLLSIVITSSASYNYLHHKMIHFKIAIPIMIMMIFAPPLGAMLSSKINTPILIILFAILDLIIGILVFTGWLPTFRIKSTLANWIVGITFGAVFGIIAGLVGRAGGPLIIIFLLILGYESKETVATGIFIASLSSITGFLGHFHSMDINPKLALVSIIAVLIGSQIGSQFMIKKLTNKSVKRIFSILLILISIKLIWDAIKIYLFSL